MKNEAELYGLIGEIQANFIYMKSLGFHAIDCSNLTLDILTKWSFENIITKPQYDSLASISADIGNCRRCLLCKERTNIVFGEGNERARLLFVGEAPGFEEDKQGKPFVGLAGQLLTRIIDAMRLKRNEVYICNVVKCRPPGNRNPNDEEVAKCIPFLKRQIAAISPEIICVLGAVASKSLLGTKTPISKLRGTFLHLSSISDIKVMPTYHPAYLLRNPNKKREVWEDVQKIMKNLG